jgi:hypothetical protein
MWFFGTLLVLYLDCITPISEMGQYWSQFIGSQNYDILNMLNINNGNIGSPCGVMKIFKRMLWSSIGIPYEVMNYYNKSIPFYLVCKIKINLNICTKVQLHMYLPNINFYKLVTF